MFTREQKAEVLRALEAKAPDAQCSFCGHTDWQLHEGFVNLLIEGDLPSRSVGNRYIQQLVAVECTTCGNTHLLNPYTLGVGRVLGLMHERSAESE